MEDFSMYNIPYVDVEWNTIQPTFFGDELEVTREAGTALSMDESIGYENSRPVSAYAMFFKERQIHAKKSFPHATFGDVSKIVAAEWDALDKLEKSMYKKRSDQLRKMQIKMAVKERLQRFFTCESVKNPIKTPLSQVKHNSSNVCKHDKQ